MVEISNADQYEKEQAKIIIDTENEENKLRKKYDIHVENIDGKHVILGKEPSIGLKEITKIRNDRDKTLKELEDKFQKLNLSDTKSDTKENRKMVEESASELIFRKDMEKNLDRLIGLQEEQQKDIKEAQKDIKESQKDIKEACKGVDCIKEDLKKFQHNHNTGGKSFESKFSGIDSKLSGFDSKFNGLESKLEKERVEYGGKLKESCEGLDCIKNQLKDIGSKVNLHSCDNCGKTGIRDGDAFCATCGREIEWFEQDGKTPLKGWKPLSNLKK